MRITWVDYSKVILICLVVFAHSPFIPHMLDTLICGFHMPAFFIISGYLHKHNSNILLGCKKNIHRLIIPALVFSFICYFLWLANQIFLHQYLSIYDLVFKPFYGLFVYDGNYATPMCGVIWFLVVLFMCFFILDITIKIYNIKGLLVLSLFCIIVVVVFNYFNYRDFMYGFYLQRAIVSFPFVAIGYIFHQKNIFVASFPKKSFSFKGILFFVFYSFLVFINGRVGIYSCTFGKSVVLYYVTSIVGSLALFYLMTIIKHSNSLIIKVSSGTIVILCIHQVMIKIFVHIYNNPYFITLAIMVICYPIILFFDKYVPWLVGRRKIDK